MGNYLSRVYWFGDSTTTNNRDDFVDAQCGPLPTLKDDNDNSVTDNNTCQTFDTPPHKRAHAKIFAAYVPDTASPGLRNFDDLNGLKSFLNSPDGRKKGIRFKQCQDQEDCNAFFKEQLSNSAYMEELNISDASGSFGTEPEMPYKEPTPTELTAFRTAIQKMNNELFCQLVDENPRFLVNTSNDLPTILHIGMRHNAMHIACLHSNVNVARRILELAGDVEWLRKAYGTDACMAERSRNLLDAFLNTPEKGRNNTPLHLVCKVLCEGIFNLFRDEQLSGQLCHAEPLNSDNERPIDVLGRNARGSRQENRKVFDRMYCALESGSLRTKRHNPRL